MKKVGMDSRNEQLMNVRIEMIKEVIRRSEDAEYHLSNEQINGIIGRFFGYRGTSLIFSAPNPAPSERRWSDDDDEYTESHMLEALRLNLVRVVLEQSPYMDLFHAGQIGEIIANLMGARGTFVLYGGADGPEND